MSSGSEGRRCWCGKETTRLGGFCCREHEKRNPVDAPPDHGKRETVNHFHIGINTLQCPVCNPGDPGAIGVPFYFDPAPRKPEAQEEIEEAYRRGYQDGAEAMRAEIEKAMRTP